MLPIVLIVFAMVVTGLVLWLAEAHQAMVFARKQVAEAWDALGAELVARREIVPYIVASVRVNSAQVLEVIGNACDLAANVAGVQACSQAEGRLTAAIGRLFALLDSVPTAVVDENVSGLRAHLAEQEARIAMLVESYNRQAETFNTLLSRSPARLLARLALFQQAELFV